MSHNLAISRYSQCYKNPRDRFSHISESQDRIMETHSIIARINAILAQNVVSVASKP